MKKNVTVRLDEDVLRKAKCMADVLDQSLSEWLTNLVTREVVQRIDYERARKQAIAALKKGLKLRPGKLTREELHERGADLRGNEKHGRSTG